MAMPSGSVGRPEFGDSVLQIPSFEQWILRNRRVLKFLGSSLAAPVIGSLFKEPPHWLSNALSAVKGGNVPSLTLVVGMNMAVAALMLVFGPRAPYRSPSGDHGRINHAAKSFFHWWYWILFIYLAFYGVYLAEVMATASTNQHLAIWPGPLFKFFENTLNNLYTLGFWMCYQIMAEPNRTEEKEFGVTAALPWLAAIIVLAVVEVFARFQFAISSQSNVLFAFPSGVLAGVAMALFVGRLESRLLASPSWLIVSLYLYAVLQCVYGFTEGYTIIEPIVYVLFLLLKLLLFTFVYWLITTPNLLMYLQYVGDLNLDRAQRQKDFARTLQPLRTSQPDALLD